jgi:eukaryotic-like serine/threonine-protein kinase
MHVGKYQLISKLAKGGMAEVFLAKAAGPMGFEKTLVLKRILSHLAEDPQFVEMFLSEAKLVAQLNHPNIVQIFDFGESEGAYYLAMEYIDGPSLRNLIKRARGAGTFLPPVFCAKVVSAACEGLAFAHDFVEPATGKPLHLIHRDISPDNLLLSRQGAVKVVDFGIAKAANQSHKTQTGLIKGKLAYMPPEQLEGQPLDRRLDVYALGVVLYELLTSMKPFDATTDVSIMRAIMFEPLVPASERRPDLPRALLQILERALAKDRESRYPDCGAFHVDLERFILSTGEPVGSMRLAQWVAELSGDAPPALPEAHPGEGGRPTVQQRAVAPRNAETVSVSRAGSDVTTEPEVRPGDGERPTVQRQVVAPRNAETVPVLRARSDAPAEPNSQAEDSTRAIPPRRYGRVMALGGLVLLAVGGGLLLFRGRLEPRDPSTADEGPTRLPPVIMQAPDGGTGKLQVDAGMPPVDAGMPPVDAGMPPVDAGTHSLEDVRPRPAPSRKVGKLRFLVRPFAVVFLDDSRIGQTPLEVEAVAGRHEVVLFNGELGKMVTQTVEVKAGQLTEVKVNLAREGG